MKKSINGKTVLFIESEATDLTKPTMSYSDKKNPFLIKSNSIGQKWMDKEELNEKHLVAAIKSKEPIPTPDVITISEEIYEKLYPANFKRSKWRILSERK